MDPLADVDATTLLAGDADWVDADLQAALVRHPLECVERAYPHYQHAVDGPDDVVDPRERHPVFYGCFDWHSAVHSHWSLVRHRRLFEDHPRTGAIHDSLDDRITRANAEREADYLASNESFENPYGWGWYLRLAAELHLWTDPQADAWADALEPLTSTVADLAATEFLARDRPFRVGGHKNAAFGLACVLDYARVVDDDDLATAAATTAREWYLGDEDYPVEYEPLGWDFLSPALAEADLLRRVLEGEAYAAWTDDFFPDLTADPYDSILEPVDVDPDDAGVALHLVGLNLSRAWCLAGVADALAGHREVSHLRASARRHAQAGVEGAFTEDYAGAHWLSSFVLYLLTRNEDGIAPDGA